jgi:DNA-binding NarL/FixJ family response regulator
MAKTLACSSELCDLASDDPLPPDAPAITAPRRLPDHLNLPDVPARVLVVDDHHVIRERILALLGFEPDLICCGEAESVAGTPELVLKLAPDLVLLDLRLRDGESFGLIKVLKERFPLLPVLVLSLSEEAGCVERALAAGACGYLSKLDGGQTIIEAMRTVLRGGTYISVSLSAGTRKVPKPPEAVPSISAQLVAQ